MYNGSGEGGGGGPSSASNGPPFWVSQQHHPMQQGGPVRYVSGNGNGDMALQHPQAHVLPSGNIYARPPPTQEAPWGPAAMLGGQRSPPPPTGSEQPLYSGPPPAFISSNAPVPIGTQVHTTVFVGTISPGVTDEWISQLLNACGPLRSFKRVNASFGFAEFIDAESVLRALAVLAGMELPVMGRREASEKGESRRKLTVKADEKTRNYLQQYEQGRMKTDDHDQDESTARGAVQAIVTQMADPSNVETAESLPSYKVPSHLKDLPPEDLPEEHRGAVLSEIDKFRQSSAARDEEKRQRDRAREMERIRASSASERTGGSSSVGRRGEAFDANDRQSYSRPVGFVASEQAQDQRTLPADERDARDAERKRQRERDDDIRAAQEAERRFLAVERTRLARWDRVMADEQADEERRHRAAQAMRQTFEQWNQAREAERDLFCVDRARWRAVRKPLLEREREDDEQDRAAQANEEERARIETERFLAQQAEEMAVYEREQRAAGVLMPNEGIHAPLKLKRVLGAAATATDESIPHPLPADVLGAAEDDGDISGLRKGRLAHIDLTDEETRKHQFRTSLSQESEAVFAKQPAWDTFDVAAHEERYKALLDDGIVEILGESVPDMVDELMSKIKTHSTASELIEVVYSVLEEEAEPLIRKLWIELLVDATIGGGLA